jgi:hypothetical protein
MTLLVRPGFNGMTDADAMAYVAAVEAADGQLLEFAVGKAINDFVVGCKLDGIWPAIKASCILAGARTLAGALVPLVGTAPTNVNFVSGDYNRKTGLGGDAVNASKYVNTNRAGNSDPQDSKHAAVYMTATGITLLGTRSSTGATYLDTGGSGFRCRIHTDSSTDDTSLVINTGLVGGSRSSSSSGTRRANGTNYGITTASQTPQAESILLFARRNNTTGTPENFSAARLAFYSIGESLDLAKLDTRVSALITAFGAAIP